MRAIVLLVADLMSTILSNRRLFNLDDMDFVRAYYRCCTRTPTRSDATRLYEQATVVSVFATTLHGSLWRSERRFAIRAVAAPPMYTTKCRIAALNEATIDLSLLLTADCWVDRSFGAIYRNFGARSAVLPFVPSPSNCRGAFLMA
jgi:hypothetical protein